METSCWATGVGGRGDLGRQTQLKPFSSPAPFYSPPPPPMPPPQICWACHLRLSHIDKLQVPSGTWARKDNKTHILLTEIFSQALGYCLAYNRHPVNFLNIRGRGREQERGRDGGWGRGRKKKEKSKEMRGRGKGEGRERKTGRGKKDSEVIVNKYLFI